MRPATNGATVEVGVTVVGSELEVSTLGIVVATPLAMVGPVGAGTGELATVLDGLDGLDGLKAPDVPKALVVDAAVEAGAADDEPVTTVVVAGVASDEATAGAPVEVVCALTVPATPTTAPLSSKPRMLRRAGKRDVFLVVARCL